MSVFEVLSKEQKQLIVDYSRAIANRSIVRGISEETEKQNIEYFAVVAKKVGLKDRKVNLGDLLVYLADKPQFEQELREVEEVIRGQLEMIS